MKGSIKRVFRFLCIGIMVITVFQCADYQRVAHWDIPQTETSDTITVHFIHGSKSTDEVCVYKRRRMGGLWGGHVELQIDDGIFGFEIKDRKQPFHYVERRKIAKYNSHFTREKQADWANNTKHEKRTSVHVPVNAIQKQKLLSICKGYQQQVPYDYAFLGMRCTASCYEVLAQVGLLPHHSKWGYIGYAFYPKHLRAKVLALAKRQKWKVTRQPGIACRKWEG